MILVASSAWIDYFKGQLTRESDRDTLNGLRAWLEAPARARA